MHHVSINIRLSFSFVSSLPYFPLITNALARRQECAVAYYVLSKTRRESLPNFRMWHIPGLIRSLLASCTFPFLLQSTLSLDSTLPLLVPFLIFFGLFLQFLFPDSCPWRCLFFQVGLVSWEIAVSSRLSARKNLKLIKYLVQWWILEIGGHVL